MRRAALAGVVVGVLAAAAVARLDPGGDRVGAMPVVRAALHGPGSPMDPFTVPSGAFLVGDMFPVGDEWTAILLVTGDPRRVASELAGAVPTCGLYADVESCIAGNIMPSSASSWLSVQTLRSVRDSSRPVSHALVRYANGRRIDGPRRLPPERRLPPVRGWSRLATTNEPFGEGNGSVLPLTVVPGSRLVAPVLNGSCGNEGYHAVLEITGDVKKVVDAYAVQESGQPIDQARRERTDGGTVIAYDGRGWEELDENSAVAVVRPGRPTYLLLTRCLDRR